MERNHCCGRGGETSLHAGEKLLLRRETALNNCCGTRGGENPLLVARRQETVAAGRRTARNHCRDGEKSLLLDAGRRETAAAATQDGVKQLLLGLGGEKSLLLDAGWQKPLLEKLTVAGRRTERNHFFYWGGEKLLLLDAGLREITAARRGMARKNDCCCWMPNVDKSLLLDEKPILLLNV